MRSESSSSGSVYQRSRLSCFFTSSFAPPPPIFAALALFSATPLVSRVSFLLVKDCCTVPQMPHLGVEALSHFFAELAEMEFCDGSLA